MTSKRPVIDQPHHESEFPDRQSEVRGYKAPRPATTKRGAFRIHPLWVFLGIAAIAWQSGFNPVHLIPDVEKIFDDIRAEVEALISPSKPSYPPAKAPTKKSLAKQVPKQRPVVADRAKVPVLPAERQLSASKAAAKRIPISISQGFRPVGFRIGVTSHTLPLASTPGRTHRNLPRFSGTLQKFAVLNLNNGQRHGLVIDAAPGGYKLYIDKNRNGDLRDDGPPLPNRGKGLFASKVSLALGRVTGIRQLEGEYELWFFTNQKLWDKDLLRFYGRTQLAGKIRLNGDVFNAYLTDNLKVDGDYRNDGISIDINGDGKIDPQGEYLPPGRRITIRGKTFSLDIQD